MCFQIFEHFDCGHVHLQDVPCSKAEDDPFWILLYCPDYQVDRFTSDHPCGKGLFYCSETLDGKYLETIYEGYLDARYRLNTYARRADALRQTASKRLNEATIVWHNSQPRLQHPEQQFRGEIPAQIAAATLMAHRQWQKASSTVVNDTVQRQAQLAQETLEAQQQMNDTCAILKEARDHHSRRFEHVKRGGNPDTFPAFIPPPVPHQRFTVAQQRARAGNTGGYNAGNQASGLPIIQVLTFRNTNLLRPEVPEALKRAVAAPPVPLQPNQLFPRPPPVHPQHPATGFQPQPAPFSPQQRKLLPAFLEPPTSVQPDKKLKRPADDCPPEKYKKSIIRADRWIRRTDREDAEAEEKRKEELARMAKEEKEKESKGEKVKGDSLSSLLWVENESNQHQVSYEWYTPKIPPAELPHFEFPPRVDWKARAEQEAGPEEKGQVKEEDDGERESLGEPGK